MPLPDNGPVPAVDGRDALGALSETYRATTAALSALSDDDWARPSRCQGWSVRDVVFHLLLDPQRALVAFASPTVAEPTTDFIAYWRPFRASSEGAVRHAEFVRRAAAAFPRPALIAEMWAETSEAALRASALSPPQGRVETQHLVIAVPDLLATLTVEAALHHLDLTVNLDHPPAAPATALEIVRTTLDGLLGTAPPVTWAAEVYALKGTGRMELDEDDRRRLGELQERFPLLG
jgi:uncharacterized protein (TIGR03083 family)